MTEAEWLTTKLPLHMLRESPAAWNERKVRLYACACLRNASHIMQGELAWSLVDAAERGTAGAEGRLALEIEHALRGSRHGDIGLGSFRDSFFLSVITAPTPASIQEYVGRISYHVSEEAAELTGLHPSVPERWEIQSQAQAAEAERQCDLIREVFGNPFRPVRAEPAWLTSDVLALARGIYDDKAFDRMPILADALQDAGCDNVNVLDHCREEREHVRGCWVIDMLLGKG